MIRYANSNPAPSEEDIKDFIDNTLLKPDRIMFFFRLINFDFQTEINIDDLILITSGRAFLARLTKDNPNRKIISEDDALLGISVIGDFLSFYSVAEMSFSLIIILGASLSVEIAIIILFILI